MDDDDGQKKNYSENSKVVATNQLMAVISDEDTCTGFALAGIGECRRGLSNLFVVHERDTTLGDIEREFNRFLKRQDIAIIVISEGIASKIEGLIKKHTKTVPAIVRIPNRYAEENIKFSPTLLTVTEEKERKSLDEDHIRLRQDKSRKSTNIFKTGKDGHLKDMFGSGSAQY